MERGCGARLALASEGPRRLSQALVGLRHQRQCDALRMQCAGNLPPDALARTRYDRRFPGESQIHTCALVRIGLSLLTCLYAAPCRVDMPLSRSTTSWHTAANSATH